MRLDQDQTWPRPGEVWATRYEAVRRQVVEESRGLGDGAGLVLLVRQGLVAWMQAWPEDVGAWPRRAEATGFGEALPVEPLRLSTDLRQQMVGVLVNMLLNRQEEPASPDASWA